MVNNENNENAKKNENDEKIENNTLNGLIDFQRISHFQMSQMDLLNL